MRVVLSICLLVLSSSIVAQEPMRAPAPIVFFDIAGPDGGALNAFYRDLFGWSIAQNGSFSTTVVSPLPGTIRQDPPETLFYIGVEDIAMTLQSVEARGGSVEYPRFEVPGVAVLGMFKDPAGNRVGLVEMLDGSPRVP